MKTRKALSSRIKITKKGKILKKANNMGHLGRKNSANKKFRKAGTEELTTKGYKKTFVKLLGKKGGKVK